jgi:SAM-dependent methyltransferase
MTRIDTRVSHSNDGSARLNVGCGHDARPGWTNLDVAPLPGVDVVHDLDDVPLPFPDDTFGHVECLDILEHVKDMVSTLRELHRILQPGGTLHIKSPHFTSHTSYIDPTHVRTFSVATFDFFVASVSPRDYYFDFTFSGFAERRICFRRSVYHPWNVVMGPLVNRNSRVQNFYEESGWSRLFPAFYVDITLIK